MYTFWQFLPSTYKFSTVSTLAYRCLRICSSWTKLQNELACLKEIFLKNDYPEDLIDKYFEKVMDNIHVVKETTLTVEKKPLVLVLQYPYKLGLSWKSHLKTFLIIVNCK